MKNRFDTLYKLQNNLYVKNSPIVILAGSLLKDNVSGKLIIQMKYQSVSQKVIKALKIDIKAIDVTGQEIENVEYQYLDLNVRKGQFFGEDKAIIISNLVARSYKIEAINIVYIDGEICTCSEAMEMLAVPQLLSTVLNGGETEKQYRLETNSYAKFAPIMTDNLWYCTCGTWNGEEHCANCSLSKERVFSAFNINELRQSANRRLIEEKARKEIQEKEKCAKLEEEHLKRIEKNNKIKKRILLSMPIIIFVVIALIFIVTKVDRIKGKAREAINDGNYLKAMEILEEIDGKEGVLELQEEVQYLMSDEISIAIKNRECQKADDLMNKYSKYLDDTDLNTNREALKIVCPHEKTINESQEPTCEVDGFNNDICELCGNINGTINKATGHEFRSEIIKEATCTEDGKEHKVCNICEYEEDVVIKKLVHSYDKKEKSKSSCEKEGECQYTCKMCGDSYTDVVKASGHSWKAATCDEPKKCNICGKTEGNASGHTWKTDNTNDRGLICKICDKAYPVSAQLNTKGIPYSDDDIIIESMQILRVKAYEENEAFFVCTLSGYNYDRFGSTIYLDVLDKDGNRINYTSIEVHISGEGEFTSWEFYVTTPISGVYYVEVSIVL